MVNRATVAACKEMRPPEKRPYIAENAMIDAALLADSRVKRTMLESNEVATVMLNLEQGVLPNEL